MAAAGSSRFAATCGLLRQYMREHQHQKRQLAALFSQVPTPLPPVTEVAAEETLQLFPLCPGMPLPSEQRPEPLTIIYGGRKHVFENIPADKAEELIQLAWSWSTPPAVPDKGVPAVSEKPAATESPLVIARMATIRRFLHKRKYRSTTGPYYTAPKNDVAAGKPAEDELAASWLSL